MKIIINLFKDLFRRFPYHFVLLFGFVFSNALFNAIAVIAIAPITDFILERTGEDASAITRIFQTVFSSMGGNLELIHVFIFFGSVNLLNAVIGGSVQYAILRIKYDMLIHMLTDTMGQFFRARFLFFSQGNMGELLNSFQQEVQKVGATFGHIARLIASVLQAVIFLMVPLALSPKLTVIFLLASTIVSSPFWVLNRFTYSLGRQNTETANRTAGVLHESLTAAKLILGFGRQRETVDRYRRSIVDHTKVSVKFQAMVIGISGLLVPLINIGALIAIYIAYLDGLPVSEMTMVLFALFRLSPIVSMIIGEKINIEGFIAAYGQLERLREEAITLEESSGNTNFCTLKQGIEFKKVTFSYSGRKPSLDKVNLFFEKGKMTALIGKSGAGKTTVIDLLLGLYDKDDGELEIDGKKIDKYDLNSFRNRVGYVPQEPQLFNASVKENLLWSAPDSSEKDMWHACRLANAEAFVRELPDQLDTTLGDRGVRLSGGQRQRLALVRAIIRQPDLLILDEATSALDTESERLIQEAIAKLAGEMTIVVIAHRLSTIRNADYVYVLHEGKLVEEGSYIQLTQMEGHFSDMVEVQMIGNERIRNSTDSN